jgi:hypothetical protein
MAIRARGGAVASRGQMPKRRVGEVFGCCCCGPAYSFLPLFVMPGHFN